MRLNVEKDTYTLRELDAVLGSMSDDDTAMRTVISEVQRAYGKITGGKIKSTGVRLGLLPAATAVIAMLEGNRGGSEPASDDDTITIGELRDALRRRRGSSSMYWPSVMTDATVDELAEDIFSHREPQWLPGDVVRDANGTFWRRTSCGAAQAWAGFGTVMYCRFDIPARPLVKVS